MSSGCLLSSPATSTSGHSPAPLRTWTAGAADTSRRSTASAVSLCLSRTSLAALGAHHVESNAEQQDPAGDLEASRRSAKARRRLRLVARPDEREKRRNRGERVHDREKRSERHQIGRDEGHRGQVPPRTLEQQPFERNVQKTVGTEGDTGHRPGDLDPLPDAGSDGAYETTQSEETCPRHRDWRGAGLRIRGVLHL